MRNARTLTAAVMLSCAAGCANLERTLVFPGCPSPEGDWNPVGLDVEDAWFNAENGPRLHGWRLAHPQPRAVILYAHGNGGNISHRAETLRMLRDRFRVTVMTFDYRGYGRSEGVPTESGVLADARAARDWLAATEGIAPSDVVLMGRSLGGAVAVDLAARDGARGLILQNTFSSLPATASHHAPYLPVRWLLRSRFDSEKKIADYAGPLLQTHGDADQIIPYELGLRLFEAAPGEKIWIRAPGAGHNDPPGEEYHQAMDRWLSSLAPRGELRVRR